MRRIHLTITAWADLVSMCRVPANAGSAASMTSSVRGESGIATGYSTRSQAAATHLDAAIDANGAEEDATAAGSDKKPISHSTARNNWGVLTGALKAAYNARDRSLRVHAHLPAPIHTGILPPKRGNSRQRPWLYPREWAQLYACKGVPAEWRYVYAVALYSGLRPGELQALTWGDVDIKARAISVSKAVDEDGTSSDVPRAPDAREGDPLAPYRGQRDRGADRLPLFAIATRRGPLWTASTRRCSSAGWGTRSRASPTATSRPPSRDFPRPEHFYSEAHRRIFEACLELRHASQPVDLVQVVTWLRSRDRLVQVGGVAYLTETLDASPAL
jgi:integrase